MTTMLEAQKDVIAEVKDRILSLAPEYEESIRFSVRDAVSRAMADLDEDTGRPRLFEIGEGIFEAPTMIGDGTRVYRYTHKITIHYPNDEDWNFGMVSDSELIRNDLLNNQTTASGIQHRLISKDTGVEIEKDEDDPWVQLTLDLVVYYEIS